jgi:hypothetical protein
MRCSTKTRRMVCSLQQVEDKTIHEMLNENTPHGLQSTTSGGYMRCSTTTSYLFCCKFYQKVRLLVVHPQNLQTIMQHPALWFIINFQWNYVHCKCPEVKMGFPTTRSVSKVVSCFSSELGGSVRLVEHARK